MNGSSRELTWSRLTAGELRALAIVANLFAWLVVARLLHGAWPLA